MLDQRNTRHPTAPRTLRLVPSSLGVVAPFVAEARDRHSSQQLLIELTSPRTGLVTSFEPVSFLDCLYGHVPAPNVEGLAAVDRRVVSLVWRSGTSFRADTGDGDHWHAPAYSLHGNDEPIVDALRRSFGLATAPAASGPAWYWLLIWLHDLATVNRAATIDMLEAARWHPGLEPDEIESTDDPAEVVERCLDRLYEHARLTGWDGVRSGAENGWLDLGRCAPPLARWFDDASFSRLLEAQLGSPGAELDRLAATDRLTPDAIAMFQLMVDGLSSIRATDCHQ